MITNKKKISSLTKLKIPGLSQSKMLSQKLMPPNGRGYPPSNSTLSKYNIPRLATDVSVYGWLICWCKIPEGSRLAASPANFSVHFNELIEYSPLNSFNAVIKIGFGKWKKLHIGFYSNRINCFGGCAFCCACLFIYSFVCFIRINHHFFGGARTHWTKQNMKIFIGIK